MKTFIWPSQRQSVEAFFRRAQGAPRDVSRAVEKVIDEVRTDGDRALTRLTRRFDGVALESDQFEIPRAELREAWKSTPRELQSALKLAARRIEAFHKRQRLRGWVMNDPALGRMELRVQAVERAGVYAPGGRAAYPSTVLMNVIPAKVAGVKEVILMTPPGKDGRPNRAVLAAAYLAKADRVFRIVFLSPRRSNGFLAKWILTASRGRPRF
ncbi:histidinol dehydrogenase [Candidatus Sumerlaeota bacterium]|nr:histidinol dehydrogenase [Candidatus Sumerlaeota bacterium]